MQFSRTSGKRFYKRLFQVGVEGTRTECDYFSMFNSPYVHVIPVASREGNSPKRVLLALKAAIPKYQLREHLPDYGKSLNRSDFDAASVVAACQRARMLLGAADPADWPREAGKTTAFMLCEAIRRVDQEEQAKLMVELSGGAQDESHWHS